MDIRRVGGMAGLCTVVIALATSGPLAGQTALAAARQANAVGGIAGRVVLSTTGAPVSQVNITVPNLSLSTQTDLDGRYVLTGVAVGTVDVVVRRIGYAPKSVTGVRVVEGQVTTLNVTVEATAVQLTGITVTAEAEEGSAVAVLDQRRSAEAVMDAIGSDEIATLPASDAADVAQRMTGVTVNDGRYVYIRGLGDRYSQTSLNRSPLPSPEPEKEVVPLDLFPSEFLEAVSTQKTYTPDQWGDFSGGTVQIETKDFPSATRWSLGAGTGVNAASAFDDRFLTYDGGGTDFLGQDDGSRALPTLVEERLGGLRGDRLPSDPATLEQIGEQLQREFTPRLARTPINRSFNGSYGTRTFLAGLETGFLFGVTYSDDYNTIRDDVEKKWRANLFDPNLPESSRIPNIDYTFDRSTRNVRIGAIGSVAFLLSPTHKIGVRTTWNRNSEDEARKYFGLNNEDLGGLVQSDRLRFVRRDLYWGQLSGEHEILGGQRIEWRGTLAQANRDEPALRETIYVNSVLADTSAPYYLEPVGESGRYLWSDLVDNDRSFEFDWSVPLPAWAGLDASVKFGGAYRHRDRDFGARRFTWTFLGSIITDIEQDLTTDNIVGAFPRPREFRLGDIVEPGDQYQGLDQRRAGYVMLDLPLTDWFRITTGTRLESYRLMISSRGDTLSVDGNGDPGPIETTDLLPAVNVIVDLNDAMSVRAAFSRTLDRPEFRELAPFQFTEAASLRQIFGNPELQPTTIRSYDLRWDYYPQPGELFSASLFYKSMDNPIEQTFISAASTAYSYQNAETAKLYGAEVDVRKRLDFLSPGLANLAIHGNLSIVRSDVTVIETGTFRPTNLSRALEGQANYSLNVGLVYKSTYSATEMAAFYNRQGKRITAAGGFGVPDIVAQPRNQLDVTFKQALAGRVRLSFKGANLLDEPIRFTQTGQGVTLPQREYKTGARFSVGLSVAR